MFPRLSRATISRSSLCRVPAQPLSLSAARWKSYQAPTPITEPDLPAAQDVPQQLLGSREEIERKRKAAEEKYAEKLKQRMAEMKAKDLEELKKKVRAPSMQPKGSPRSHAVETPTATPSVKPASAPKPSKSPKNEQAAADRSGVKPLSQILNLDLIYAHPHTTDAIASLWQHYHTAHPTLSSTFLSATIPPHLYAAMIDLARKYPNFVVPLPRDPAGESNPKTSGDSPAFEMFYLQWLFHPTPSNTSASSETEGKRNVPRLPIASVLFTPLAEFKNSSEWAQPHLVLTHYPDLHNNPIPCSAEAKISPGEPRHHPLVLMRGEISPSTTKSSIATPLPSANLALTQAQAQLLALAVQRFYCSDVAPAGESAGLQKQREERGKSLRDFRERPSEWEWKGLVGLAYAGVV